MMQTMSCFAATLEAIEASNISGFFYSSKREQRRVGIAIDTRWKMQTLMEKST
jgi:hypothetical protein